MGDKCSIDLESAGQSLDCKPLTSNLGRDGGTRTRGLSVPNAPGVD